jgi:hypothetical protein
MELKKDISKPPRPRHPKYEVMTLRLAKRFGIDEGAETYEALPQGVKCLYSHFSYLEIVRPLICLDKKENPAMSFSALANRYGVSRIGAYQMVLNWLGRDMAEK